MSPFNGVKAPLADGATLAVGRAESAICQRRDVGSGPRKSVASKHG